MRRFTDITDPDIASFLLAGNIGVIRTDTLYGLIAKADDQAAVERIFAAKGRSEHKSPIVLVASVDQLFDAPTDAEKQVFERVWPGKVSVIVPSDNAPVWIERGNHSVAYRLPDDEALLKLLEQTGPLVAPSANTQGEQPAATIDEAVRYFGDQVDFYVDGGRVGDNTPSKLIRVERSGKVEQLR